MSSSAAGVIIAPLTTPNSPDSVQPSTAISNRTVDGNIGTAALTVDTSSAFVITQTSAGRTLTLPSPTTASAARLVTVTNSVSSSASFSFYGKTLLQNDTATVAWTGSEWSSSQAGLPSVSTSTSPTAALSGAGTSASPLSASVTLSASAGNVLAANPDGLFVPTPTVSTSSSRSLSLGGNGGVSSPLTGDVVIDPVAGNALVLNASGLYVSTPTPFTLSNDYAVPGVGGGQFVLGDLFGGGVISGVDQQSFVCVTQTTAGQTMSLASPSNGLGRVIHVRNVGTATFTLYGISVEPGYDYEFSFTTSGGWRYSGAPLETLNTTSTTLNGDGTNASPLSATVVVSPTAGNTLTSTASGLYVPTPAAGLATVTSTDSTTIDFTGAGTAGSPLTATAVVAPTAGNTLTSTASGLYVPTPATGLATVTSAASQANTVSGAGTAGSPLVVDTVVSPTAGNVLVSTASGLYVPTPSVGGTGTVTNVSSATAAATVANPTTTPVITVVSAPKLTTARNINGVAFDGTTNITVADATKQPLDAGLTSISALTGAGYVKATATDTFSQTATIPNTDITGLGTLSTQNGTFSGVSSGTNTGDQTITLTSDVTGSGTGTFAATLATVNANVGTFGSASNVAVHTVNAKGLITAASNTPIQIAESQVTNLVTDLAAKKTDSMSTSKLLGRGTAGTGAIEEITLGANLSLTGTTLNAASSATAFTTQDEGTALSATVNTLNFVGAGVTATGAGATTTVTIPGGSPISALTAGTAANTIDSANFAQTWNWSTATTQTPLAVTANALTTGSVIDVKTSSGALNSTNGLLHVENTGTSQSGKLAQFKTASGAPRNGLTLMGDGKLGVGIDPPLTPVHVYSKNGGQDIALRMQNDLTGFTGNSRLEFVSGAVGSEFRMGYITSADGGGFAGTIKIVTNGVGSSNLMGSVEAIQAVNGSVGIGGVTPVSTLDTIGSFGNNIIATTLGSYTLAENDHTVVTTLVGSQTIVFPDAPGRNRREYVLVNPTTAAKSFLTGSGVVKDLTGTAIGTLPANSVMTVQCDGTNWIQTNIGSATVSAPLSSLTAGVATNTIDSTNFAQTWNWSTATTQSPLTLTGAALTTAPLLTLTPAANAVAVLVNGRSSINVGTTTNNTAESVTGSINDFLEEKVKNTSTGTGAQSGFTAESDSGTSTSGFAWMGINNSAFANPQLYNAGVAGDVTYVGSGQDLIIANANNAKAIKFQTGKATTPFFDNRMTIMGSGNVGVGTIAPNSLFEVFGPLGTAFRYDSTATPTASATDSTIVLTLAATQTVTLPAASTCKLRQYMLVNQSAVAKVTSVGYYKLDGTLTTTIPALTAITIQADGISWVQISNTTAASGSTAISALTAGTAANTIDSTTLAQTWNWSTATTQTPLTLTGAALTTAPLLTLTAPAGKTALNATGHITHDTGVTTTNSALSTNGTINDFSEIKIKNQSTGTQAQTGFTAESHNGSTTTGFAWMGINNENFAFPTVYNAGVAGDTTFVGSGNDMIIANASQTKAIKFQTGKATTPFFDDRMAILNSGLVGINTLTPLSTLEVNGSFGTAMTTTGTAAYTVTATDSTILLTSTSAQVLTLPAATSFYRRILTISNTSGVAKTTAANYSGVTGGTNAIPAYSVLTLQSDGNNWVQTSTPVNSTKITTITASGTFTPTPGVRTAVIEMCGAGGAAGGCAATAVAQCSIAGHGNPGGYLKFQLTAAQLGAAAVTVTVGVGGAAAAVGSNTGGTGGNTSFGAFATCNGGSGGLGGGASGSLAGVGQSTGGVTFLTTGSQILNFSAVSTSGTVILFSSSLAWHGMATSLPVGQGNGYGFDGGTSRTSLSGTGYGVGSSAPFNFASQAGKPSVAGQPGVVIVTEYF